MKFAVQQVANFLFWAVMTITLVALLSSEPVQGRSRPKSSLDNANSEVADDSPSRDEQWALQIEDIMEKDAQEVRHFYLH